jgi:hypothetical protein
MTELSQIESIPEILGLQAEYCNFVYTTKSSIFEAIYSQRNAASPVYKQVIDSLEIGSITWEQAVLALDKYNYAPDILVYMGLKDFRYAPAKSVIANEA